MKPRDYCCCAIPVIYAGIYTALLEQFVLGVTAGVLSIATTDSESQCGTRYLRVLIHSISRWSVYPLIREVDIRDCLLGRCRCTNSWLPGRTPGT